MIQMKSLLKKEKENEKRNRRNKKLQDAAKEGMDHLKTRFKK